MYIGVFLEVIMSTVTLTKWGNSVGVRIPALILKEADLAQGSELDICTKESGVIILKQKENKQEGWTSQFNAIADGKNEEIILDVSSSFDDEEWTW
tara:strand:+ start:271 stop:558 length:288 start_codon:yes stop_codon:yes gene_type:complete